jgi:large subunit ribosomal protein L6
MKKNISKNEIKGQRTTASIGRVDGVKLSFDSSSRKLTASGKQGDSSIIIHPSVLFTIVEGVCTFQPKDNQSRALAGTMRALTNNLVIGLSRGFTKTLEIIGVGYRAQVNGEKLQLLLGFSHEVSVIIPEGLAVQVDNKGTTIEITGNDKQLVGQFAADIRAYRPPEPYKGKGVRYQNEKVIRKAGKTKK